MDDIVNVLVLGGQPVNGGLAFLGHVGNDGSSVQAGVSIDGTVEQDDLDAGVLSVLQNGVPTGGAGGGQQQVVNFVLDELLGGSDLLFVLQGVSEGSIIAVFLGEGLLQVGVVGGTVAGLVGVVVDDADLDQLVRGSGGSLGGGGSLSLGGLGSGGSLGSSGGSGTAAGSQSQNHCQNQQYAQDLLHDCFLNFLDLN